VSVHETIVAVAATTASDTVGSNETAAVGDPVGRRAVVGASVAAVGETVVVVGAAVVGVDVGAPEGDTEGEVEGAAEGASVRPLPSQKPAPVMVTRAPADTTVATLAVSAACGGSTG
jgi:hypothetical protein